MASHQLSEIHHGGSPYTSKISKRYNQGSKFVWRTSIPALHWFSSIINSPLEPKFYRTWSWALYLGPWMVWDHFEPGFGKPTCLMVLLILTVFWCSGLHAVAQEKTSFTPCGHTPSPSPGLAMRQIQSSYPSGRESDVGALGPIPQYH